MTELAQINEHSTEIANPENQTMSVFFFSAKLTWSFLLHPKQLQDTTCKVSETHESSLNL